jgi:quercetin dioxygenase-like cupin family protein
MSTHASKPAARVETWHRLPVDHPMPLIARQRIIGTHMMVSKVTLEPGFFVPSHHHANEQFVVVVSGHARFALGAEGTPDFRTVEVRGGDVLVVPPHVPHSCLALERTEILDLFSPPSATTGVDAPRS